MEKIITFLENIAMSIPILFSVLFFYFIFKTDKNESKARRKKMSFEKNNIYYKDKSSNIAIGYFVFGTSFFISIIITYFIKSFNFNNISSDCLTLTGITISVLIFIAIFNKKQYILFTIKEILEYYKLPLFVVLLLISTIEIFIFNIFFNTPKYNYIILSGILMNCFSNFYILYNLFSIILFDKKDFTLLTQLHRLFFLNDVEINMINKESWKFQFIRENFNKLNKEYINLCNHKSIFLIKEIIYSQNLNKYTKEKYSKAKSNCYLYLISMHSYSLLFIYLRYKYNEFFIFMFLSFIFTFVLIKYTPKDRKKNIIKLGGTEWVYIINNKKVISVFLSNKNINYKNRYIHSLNNINAFFYIWIYLIKGKKQIINSMLNTMIDDIQNLDKEKQTVTTYFPIFTIGYFLYDVDYKNNRLKNIYAQLSSSNDFKKKPFKKMISHQLIYLSKGKRTYNIKKYINWLTQKIQ